MNISPEEQWLAFSRMVEMDSPYQERAQLVGGVKEIFFSVYDALIRQHAKIKAVPFSREGKGCVDLMYLDHYLILSLRFSNALLKAGGFDQYAGAVYYSRRMRTCTDIFCRTEIGECFLPSHPLGSVIDSRATYGFGFQLNNGVHVGPWRIPGKPETEMVHPAFGDGVILYPKVSVFGNSVIGNNVTITTGSLVVNEVIPDNCTIFGSSPNLRAVPNKYNNLEMFDI